MNKLFAVILILVLANLNVYCQTKDIFKIIDELNEPLLYGEIVSDQERTKGNQFLFESWTVGNVTLVDGSVAKNRMLNYNGYTDQLHLFNTVTLKNIVLEKSAIHEFSLLNKAINDTLFFRSIDAKVPYSGKQEKVFVQVLQQGRFTLLAFRQVVETGKETFQQSNKVTEIKVVKPKTKFFIQFPDKSVVPFSPTGKSSVKTTFIDENETVKKLIKDNKLRLKRENDLIKLIQLLNENHNPNLH